MSNVKDTSKAAFYSTERGDVEQKVYNAFAVGLIESQIQPGPEQYAVCTRREAAEYTGIQASTVSGVVNRLIKAGWLVVQGKTLDQITGRYVEDVRIVGGRHGTE